MAVGQRGLSLGVPGLSPAVPKIDRFAGDVAVWEHLRRMRRSQGGDSCDRSLPAMLIGASGLNLCRPVP